MEKKFERGEERRVAIDTAHEALKSGLVFDAVVAKCAEATGRTVEQARGNLRWLAREGFIDKDKYGELINAWPKRAAAKVKAKKEKVAKPAKAKKEKAPRAPKAPKVEAAPAVKTENQTLAGLVAEANQPETIAA